MNGVLEVDVNEVATRLLRRYWLLLLVTNSLPMVAVVAYVLRQPATYTSEARLLSSATVPRSPAESASVVSQVTAFATSRDVIVRALSDAKVSRDPDEVAKAVSVTGLGTSALVNLAYTDQQRAAAQQVTAALADAVVRELDANRAGRLPEVIDGIDKQLADLNTKRIKIASDAAARPRDTLAQSRLDGTDRRIAGLLAARAPLAENLATAGQSSVVAAASTPLHPDSRGLIAKLGIAGLLALAVGLIIMGVNEAVRPRIAGAPEAGRLLDAPVLGGADDDPARLAETSRRIRLAAARARVSTIVLARADGSPPPPAMVDHIEDAVLRPYSTPGRVPVGADSTDPQLLPKFDDDGADGQHHIAILTRTQHATAQPRLRRVCGVDEIDTGEEGERAGLVVVAGTRMRNRDLKSVGDLLAMAGWPLLGVIAEGRLR